MDKTPKKKMLFDDYVSKVETDPKYQPYVDKLHRKMKTQIWNEQKSTLSTYLEAAQDAVVQCLDSGKPMAEDPIILDELKHLILMGYTQKEIQRMLLAKHPTGDRNNQLEYLMPIIKRTVLQNIKDYLKDVYSHNVEMIFSVLYQSDKQGDSKTKLQAIDMLNKMAGAYTQKVEVQGVEPIVLNFNQ